MTSWGGLDFDDLDGVTAAEREEFSSFYIGRFDHAHRGLEFMLDERPDALKRFRWFVYNYEAREYARRFGFAFMTYYALMGYADGVRYTMRARQQQGFTRDQIRDAIAMVFLRTGPYGGDTMALAVESIDWSEEYAPLELPEGWDTDYTALRSGLDFSRPELAPGEHEMLRDWYMRTIGEVPPHVDFLARHDPVTLKANRNRWENTLKHLPKQCLPYTMLGFDMLRGARHGIRENTLLCKAFGVTKSQTIGSISAALEYGGPDHIDRAAEVTSDIFDSWD